MSNFQDQIDEEKSIGEGPYEASSPEGANNGQYAQQLLQSPDRIPENGTEDKARKMLQSEYPEGENTTQPIAESIIIKVDEEDITSLNQQQSSYILKKRAEDILKDTIHIPEVSEKVQEEGINKMPDTFFYPADHIDTSIEDYPVSRKCLKFINKFGHDSYKRYNLWALDDQTLFFSSGISYHFYNFENQQDNIFFSRDGGGIGSISVHPRNKFYAVAEKGTFPNVYIFTYPNHQLYRILRKGTERSYSSCMFSEDGDKLASVGSSPDYQICIWDWKQENILLKAKAFAQEVYRVSFSQHNPNLLCTAGMGHIKFWKVAETFTGLKLKGEIAKFGQVELSDVYAFYQFPDGKVLSGTEYGRLILWEGNVIKCVIGVNEETPAHDGAIEVIFQEGDYIVSAGADGFIRTWRMQDIDQAEGDDQQNYFMKPSKEIQLVKNSQKANILQISRRKDFWLVGDANGYIWKLDYPKFETQQIIYTSNSGKFYDLAISRTQNIAVTVGQDGQVCLWDYINDQLYCSRNFPCQATAVEWLPYTKVNLGRVIVVGFSNGIIRVLLLEEQKIVLLKAMKVHPQPITHIKVSSDGKFVAVFSSIGSLFLLKTVPNDVTDLEPFCLFETSQSVTDITWDHRGSETLLFGTKDGKLLELKVPQNVNNSQTYLVPFQPRVWTIKMMESQKPKKEEMDLEFLLRRNKDEKIPEVEWEPQAIMNVAYLDNDCKRVIATVDGKYQGYLYVIDWNKDRPIDSYVMPKIPTQYMCMDIKSDLLLVGFRNGSFQVRHRNDLRLWTGMESHDMDYGKVRKVAVNFDRTAILSVGEDGTFYIYSIDYNSLIQSTRGLQVEVFDYPKLQYELNSQSFLEPVLEQIPKEEDIINDKIYSIQEAKLLAEEDNKKTDAEKKKQVVLNQVKVLREQFESVVSQNKVCDEMSKLTQDELCVDPEYIQMLHERVKDDLEETRRELEWDQYFTQLMTNKLKKYMKDELEVDRFTLKGIKQTKLQVSTFKVKNLSEYVKQQLAEIYRLIDEERSHQLEKEKEIQITQNQQAIDGNNISTLNKQIQNNNNILQGQSQAAQIIQQQEDLNQQENDKTKKSSAKAERERQKQEEEKIRREQEELEKTKPTKESFEPDHLRDIQEATETLGDYKLKSSQNYVVPEHLRMNVSKKRKHMFLLEEFLHNTKLKFNLQLIALKQKKIELIQKIKSYNQTIKGINQELGKNEQLFSPEIDKESEDPDSFMNINDEQIDEWAKQKAKDTGKSKGGFSMGGGAQQQSTPAPQEEKKSTPQPAQPTKQLIDPKDQIKSRKGIRIQASLLEDEMKVIQEMILQAEKKRMLEEIEEEIIGFDKDLLKCKNEKNVLESDMTIARMKLVTFYQELLILEDMEEYDNKLIKELLEFKKEKQALDDQGQKIVESLLNLAKKEAQNEKELGEQMKAFKELVYPDDDGKREKIHQHYLRKFKKDQAKKMKVSVNDDEEDDEDEDGDGSEEEEEEDDEYLDDDDEKPDLSPVENDPKIKDIIDKICELENNQEINRKEKIDFERQKTVVTNKTVTIQKDLKRAEDDLRSYQRKKLQKVNQLDVSFMLKFSQIQNLIEQGEIFRLPIDLNVSILFTEQEFYRLCRRIREIQLEQKKIERQKKLKEKAKKVLEKETAIKDAKISDLNKKYEEKHMLKFGDIIDLKVLDALEPTKQVIEMRDAFKLEEKESVKKVEEAKRNLQVYKNRLLDSKRENTKIINNITKLGKQQMELSKKLDSTNKQLFKEENEERRSDLEREKQNLKDLVKFLSKEIEDLKTEIGLFKRKGGHIYTMVTSTKKQLN